MGFVRAHVTEFGVLQKSPEYFTVILQQAAWNNQVELIAIDPDSVPVPLAKGELEKMGNKPHRQNARIMENAVKKYLAGNQCESSSVS
jgi:hypothetical protein